MTLVILTDEADNSLRLEDSVRAHENGDLHRAFSVFVFDREGKILLQRRSHAKRQFPGLWTNTCCGHPISDDALGAAAEGRLREEMGFTTPLREVAAFVYKAVDRESGRTEHEYDHVFVGTFDGQPFPDPLEAEDWKWSTLEAVRADVSARPEAYTPWFPLALQRLPKDSGVAGVSEPRAPSPTSQHLDPSHIIEVGSGFWRSKTLLSAVELEVFTRLGGESMTGDQLAGTLGLHPRATWDFLDALVALGFLDRDGEGKEARYRNTDEAAVFLDKKSERYMGVILEMFNARSYRLWDDLTEALTTGKPPSVIEHTGRPIFDKLYRDPAMRDQFLDVMAGISLRNVQALAEQFDFSKYATLCDVGGATGQLSVVVATRHHHLRCTSFDLPVIEPTARKTIEDAGLSDRIATASGDFFKDPLPQADVITMSMILHDWDLPKKMQLIQAAYDALPHGGALVIVEHLIDDARCENIFGLMMSLNMLVEVGDGFEFTASDFARWCGQVGFQDVEVLGLGGPASAVVAFK